MGDDPAIGREVDGYRITAVLGRGGMGAVYKGEQLSIKRLMAIKHIDPAAERFYDLRMEAATIRLPAEPDAGPRAGWKTLKVLVGAAQYITERRRDHLPEAIGLTPNYPNPFSTRTTFSHAIPQGDGDVDVEINVYNLLGAAGAAACSGDENARAIPCGLGWARRPGRGTGQWHVFLPDDRGRPRDRGAENDHRAPRARAALGMRDTRQELRGRDERSEQKQRPI